MNYTDDTPRQSYKSLTEIHLKKEDLLKDIRKDDKQIQNLWKSLFHNDIQKATTRSQRFSGLINTGAGILDGIILGWKLYRKFKRK